MAGREIASAYIALIPSAKGIAGRLESELKGPADRAGRDAGQAIEEGITGGGERGGRRAATAVAGAIGGAAILRGLSNVKDAASDLNETVNVTEITFGEASDQVGEFAENAAQSLGQSERAAREAAASFGGLLQNIGYTESAAADTSIQLTTLASDLASAFNTDPADAVQALGSALRGESEPIRKYNVLLSEQALQQYAVENGLTNTLGPLDQNTRAQAALGLIMEQTSRYQGDFANTADSAANAARIAAAEQENAAADIGQAVLPVYERMQATLATLAQVFGALPEPVQTAIVALAGVAALAGPINSVVTVYRTFTPAVAANTTAVVANATATNSAAAVTSLYAVSTTRAAAASRLASVAAGTLTAALGGLAIGYGIVNASRERAASAGSEEAQELQATLAATQTYQQFVDQLNVSIGRYNDIVDDANSGADIFANDDLAEYSHELGPILEQHIALNSVIEAYAARTGDADGALRLFSGHAAEAAELLASGLTPEAAAAELAVRAEAEAATTAANNTAVFGDAAAAAADALEATNSALDDLFNISDTLPVISVGLRDALRGAAEEAERLAAANASGEEQYDAFVGVVSGSIGDLDDYTRALLDQGASSEQAAALTNAHVDQVFALAAQFGLTETQAAELRTQLGLDYPDVETTVTAYGLAEANSRLATLRAQMDAINGRNISFVVNSPGLDAGLYQSGREPRAAGGAVYAGQSYWVGEKGPEPFTPAVNGYITPADQMGMPSAALSIDPSASMDDLMTLILRWIRINGESLVAG